MFRTAKGNRGSHEILLYEAAEAPKEPTRTDSWSVLCLFAVERILPALFLVQASVETSSLSSFQLFKNTLPEAHPSSAAPIRSIQKMFRSGYVQFPLPIDLPKETHERWLAKSTADDEYKGGQKKEKR